MQSNRSDEERFRMASTDRVGDMEISHDLGFHQRAWTVQRVGWGILALLGVAALLGLLGSGPLAHGAAGSRSGPLWLEYDRFAHVEADSMLQVHMDPGPGNGGAAALAVSRDYFDHVQLEEVAPPPLRVELGPHQLTYVFAVADAGGPAEV